MTTIRRAREGEGEHLGSLLHASRVASIPAIPPPVHSEAEVRAWFATKVLPASEVWVAEAGGRPVAVMVLRDDWLDHLYVSAGWTGKGIGSELMEVAKRRRPG